MEKQGNNNEDIINDMDNDEVVLLDEFSMRNSKSELLNKIKELMIENNTLKEKMKLMQQQISKQQGTIVKMRISLSLEQAENSAQPQNSTGISLLTDVKEEQGMANNLGAEYISYGCDNVEPRQKMDMKEELPLVTGIIDADEENCEQYSAAGTEQSSSTSENTDIDHTADVSHDSVLSQAPGIESVDDDDAKDTESEVPRLMKRRRNDITKQADQFECQLCRKLCSQKSYESHMVMHDRRGKMNFSCKHCDRKFHSKSGLSSHNVKVHKNGDTMEICPICEASVWCISTHMKHHISDKGEDSCDQKRFSCNICGKSFKQSCLVVYHMRIHTKVMPYECQICNTKFAWKNSLKRHTRKCKGAKIVVINFTCEICDKHFKSKSGYGDHMRLKHSSSAAKTTCNVCGRHVVDLTEHMRVHDPDDLPFQCCVCGKRYRAKASLEFHMQDHTGERACACQICDKGFKSKGNLKDHMRIHTGERRFICDICGHKTTTGSNLRKHKLRHTGTKPFSCTVCSKAFVSKHEMNNHMNFHFEAKPYTCKICEKGFKTGSMLSIHRFVHSGERKYKCLFCEDRFKQLAHRNTHMKLVHKHVMKPKQENYEDVQNK